MKLRKEQGTSQGQPAQRIHVTRQAVSNWEIGRSQLDLDMLETLASAFGTDILVVIYGQMLAGTDEETRSAVRKRHLKEAAFWGILALTSYLILTALGRHLDALKTRTYSSMSYILLQTSVMPLISVGFAASLIHVLNVAGTVRIVESGMRKKLLVVGGLTAALHMLYMLWLLIPLSLFPGAPLWTWHMPFFVIPHTLFFFIGLLLYLGLDHDNEWKPLPGDWLFKHHNNSNYARRTFLIRRIPHDKCRISQHSG